MYIFRYTLGIAASDGAHTVETTVDILVTDENDSAPEFDKEVYTGVFSANMSLPAAVATVHAVDNDTGVNGQVKYDLVGSDIGYIDENGTIYVNNTDGISAGTELHLVVSASDEGTPRQRGYVSVRLQNLQHSDTSPQFNQQSFNVIIDAGAQVGSRLANLEVPYSGGNLFYSLDAGSGNPYIALDSASGALVLKKRIDDPKQIPQSLGVTLRRDNRLGEQTTARVNLKLGPDIGSNNLFQRKYRDVDLSEAAETGVEVFKAVSATSPGYELRIASGNYNQTFQLSSTQPGSLVLNKPLDYETKREYKLVLLATNRRQFDTMTVVVRVIDENDNRPFFPVRRQIHSIPENSAPGSLVLVAAAEDLDSSDSLVYSISSEEFSIGQTNGRVVTKRSFDYEIEQEFNFQLLVEDSTGAKASADVTVKIESVDEYHPAFAAKQYNYPVDRLYPAGHIVGRVKATDQDAGPSGRVVYSVAPADGYFAVDSDTGEIFVSRNLDTGLVGPPPQDPASKRQFQDVTYVVQASSGREESLKTSALLIFQVNTEILPPAPLPSTAGGVAAWGQAVIIAIVFILIILAAGIFFFKRFSVNKFIQKRLIDPNSPGAMQTYSGSMHDTSTMDSTVPISQFPPQYSDIINQYGHSHGKVGL